MVVVPGTFTLKLAPPEGHQLPPGYSRKPPGFSPRSCWEPGRGPRPLSCREALNLASESGPDSWVGMWSREGLSRSQRAHCAWGACVIPPPVLTLFLFLQSGGGSVPPMKVVTPGTSRLKAAQGQAGSPDKGKHGKQRAEYMRIQAQQQVSLGTTGAGPGPHPDPLPLPTGSAVCWPSLASIPVTTFLPAAQRGPPCQDCPTGPLSHLLLPLSSPSAQDLVLSQMAPFSEGPSLRTREGCLLSRSWTRPC